MTILEIIKTAIDAGVSVVAMLVAYRMYQDKEDYRKETEAKIAALSQQAIEIQRAENENFKEFVEQHVSYQVKIKHDLENVVSGQEGLTRLVFTRLGMELPDDFPQPRDDDRDEPAPERFQLKRSKLGLPTPNDDVSRGVADRDKKRR